MQANKWVKYRNGNYTVYFDTENGTKIRRCPEKEFKPAFPENCDVLISTKCNHECPWCYAGCSPEGEFGELLNNRFIETLHPFTELAININFPIHPQLYSFLNLLKEKQIIANATINQDHFLKNEDIIKNLYDNKLIYGLGVSLTKPTDLFIHRIKNYKRAVIHVINGVLTEKELKKLKDNNLKILILGYKDFGFGTSWHEKQKEKISQNMDWLYNNLPDIINSFETVSFDNLALKQLDVKRLMSEKEWEMFYMGDDGTMTFAINLVDKTFSPNSVSLIKYNIDDKTIEEMFNQIRKTAEV